MTDKRLLTLARLQAILGGALAVDFSVAHLYNLGRQTGYQRHLRAWTKTRPLTIAIGERRAPAPKAVGGQMNRFPERCGAALPILINHRQDGSIARENSPPALQGICAYSRFKFPQPSFPTTWRSRSSTGRGRGSPACSGSRRWQSEARLRPPVSPRHRPRASSEARRKFCRPGMATVQCLRANSCIRATACFTRLAVA